MSSPQIAIDARLVGRDNTGDSTYWTGLLHGLAEINTSLEFLLISNGPPPPGIPKVGNFHWITATSGSSRWWSLVKFPLLARKLGARAIHTQYNLSPLVGRRGITTIHDVSFLIGPEWFRPRDLFLLKRFVPSSAKRAARVVTVSQTSKGEIERLIPAARGKVEAAYLGPQLGLQPTPAQQAREVVERQLGLAGPYMLTVGTRWPRKNMSLAVQAASLLPEVLPHRLVVTGKGGWGEQGVGVRGFETGFVSLELLSALYSAADLYLAPSFHEGFGLPVLEAFTCGCPVLCSNGGSLPEVAGDAAMVMRSWEPGDWAKTIETLLMDSSKLESMRERGLERAAGFSWEACAAVHERVYREVAS